MLKNSKTLKNVKLFKIFEYFKKFEFFKSSEFINFFLFFFEIFEFLNIFRFFQILNFEFFLIFQNFGKFQIKSWWTNRHNNLLFLDLVGQAATSETSPRVLGSCDGKDRATHPKPSPTFYILITYWYRFPQNAN